MKSPFNLTVQIQTIDACNAKCYQCPYSYIYHAHKKMSDDVFTKLIYEIALLGKKNIKFAMYLQNEPLMDNLLFKRVSFIKKIIPNSVFEISTNCLLLPKYYKLIEEFFDIIILSIQAWDAESYNLIHRTNISKEHFQKILDTAHYLKDNKKDVFLKQFKPAITDGYEKREVDKWYKMRYSRAGFLTNNKIIKKEVHGCKGQKHKFINVLFDGSLILCCMDYIRETIYGNIKHQTLNNIYNSKLYKTYIGMVEGVTQSEPDFICKRCELSI